MSWKMSILLVGLSALTVGCGRLPKRPDSETKLEPFREVYKAAQPALRPKRETTTGNLSFRVEQASLPAFILWLSETSGVTIVWEQGLDSQTITLAMREASLADVLAAVSRRLGTQTALVGKAWYLGELRPEDFATAAVRVRRLPAEEVSRVMAGVTRNPGSGAFASADGLVIIVDRVEVVRKALDLIEQLDSVESVTWAVQLWVVSMRESDLRDIGVDVRPSVDLAAALAGASGSFALPAQGTQAAVGLDVTMRAIANGERGQLLADPLMLLVDGSSATLHRGQTIPVRQTSVEAGQGSTVSQTGYTSVQAGLVLTCEIREVSESLARLDLRLSLSDVLGYRDGAPELSVESFDTSADVAAGGVYLLGSLRRQRSRTGYGQWLTWGTLAEREASVMQVWAKVYRVGSSADEAFGERTEVALLRDLRRADAAEEMPSPVLPTGVQAESVPHASGWSRPRRDAMGSVQEGQTIDVRFGKIRNEHAELGLRKPRI